MAEIVGARLDKLIQERRTSQSALARDLGVSQPTIGRLITGETRETGKIIELARALKTTPEYLIGETDDDSPSARVVIVTATEIGADEDLIEIDSIDLKYGMGASFLDTDHVEVEKVKFTRSWISQFTNSPQHMLCSTRGMGDSMMPTIHDQDVLIIDRSQTQPEMGDKIWAIVFSGMGMIKRLRAQPDGRIRISSDNQLIRDDFASDGDLFVVGRVVAVVKSV